MYLDCLKVVPVIFKKINGILTKSSVTFVSQDCKKRDTFFINNFNKTHPNVI